MAQQSVFPFADAGRPGLAVRTIAVHDIIDALRRGLDDFNERPTHRIFVYLIYPVLGLAFLAIAMQRDLVPLMFPLVSGFALVGPFLAIGLYQMSRCRERGEPISVGRAFNIFRCPAKGTLFSLGLILAALFFAWLVTALLLYQLTVGQHEPQDAGDFLRLLVATPEGMELIVFGNGLGFIFALVALAISAISFPLILDRQVSLGTAILTSVDAIVKNPIPMLAWGLIVGALLFVGALPALVGLAVVFPILGHATWHVYRKVVV